MDVRVLHSVNLRQSAVQLFVQNEMKIVSHLVGVETIGFEDIANCKSARVRYNLSNYSDPLGQAGQTININNLQTDR